MGDLHALRIGRGIHSDTSKGLADQVRISLVYRVRGHTPAPKQRQGLRERYFVSGTTQKSILGVFSDFNGP